MTKKASGSMAIKATVVVALICVVLAVTLAKAEAGFYLLLGLCLSYSVMYFPKNLIRRWGKSFFMEANFITVVRTPVALAGIVLFMQGTPALQFCGYLLMILGLSADRLDGRIAAINADLRTEKAKRIGSWLDPLFDKITMYGLFCVILFHGLLWWPLVLAAAIPDLVNTVSRSPFVNFTAGGLAGPLQFLAPYFKANAATGIGKYKFALQFTTLLACLPFEKAWISTDYSIVPNVFLGVAVLMGVLSLLSRLNVNIPLLSRLEVGARGTLRHE